MQGLARLFYNKFNRRIAAGALFGGLLLKNSLKHVFPDDLFFPFYAYPSSQIMEAVKLLNSCKEDMGLTVGAISVVPFVSSTTEVCSAGFSAFKLSQSRIGIPVSFFCKTVEEISHHEILWGKLAHLQRSKGITFQKVDENEVKLMESLLLPEDAKRFAVARHLSYIRRNWAIYQSLVSPCFVIVGYIMAFHCPKLMFTSNKPVPILTIFGASLVGIIVSYLLCKITSAALTRKIMVQADTDAAKISAKYAKGGVEMYDKLCETNQALRILLGKKGERLYSKDGNLKSSVTRIFDSKSPNFTERKKYLNEILLAQTSPELHSVSKLRT